MLTFFLLSVYTDITSLLILFCLINNLIFIYFITQNISTVSLSLVLFKLSVKNIQQKTFFIADSHGISLNV